MSRRAILIIIMLTISVVTLLVVAVVRSNDMSEQDTVSAPQTNSTNSTLQFADPESDIGEWIRDPSCPSGTQASTIWVRAEPESAYFVSTNAEFGEDGRASYITVTAEGGVIEMVYEIEYAPAAAEGNPDGGSVPWAFWRYLPDTPAESVRLEGPWPGFTAGNRVMVCTS